MTSNKVGLEANRALSVWKNCCSWFIPPRINVVVAGGGGSFNGAISLLLSVFCFVVTVTGDRNARSAKDMCCLLLAVLREDRKATDRRNNEAELKRPKLRII